METRVSKAVFPFVESVVIPFPFPPPLCIIVPTTSRVVVPGLFTPTFNLLFTVSQSRLALLLNALVPAPNGIYPAVSVVIPVPPFATGSVPVTPVVSGRPVALVRVTDVGVPRIGVVKVGEVPNTNEPDPVSSDITPASSDEVVEQ